MSEAQAEALREAERFIAYYSGETDGCFVGTGTPSKCLEQIRAALAEHDAAPRDAGHVMLGDMPPFEAIPGQSFECHQTWVNKAQSWLTSHPRYRNTEQAKGKGWQGEHFTALCFDQKGRRCRNGGDMQRAHDEGAFPVWWVWPDQIAALLMPATQEGGQ